MDYQPQKRSDIQGVIVLDRNGHPWLEVLLMMRINKPVMMITSNYDGGFVQWCTWRNMQNFAHFTNNHHDDQSKHCCAWKQLQWLWSWWSPFPLLGICLEFGRPFAAKLVCQHRIKHRIHGCSLYSWGCINLGWFKIRFPQTWKRYFCFF